MVDEIFGYCLLINMFIILNCIWIVDGLGLSFGFFVVVSFVCSV